MTMTKDNEMDTMTIDLAWSVNELLDRRPASVAVLNAFGVDTCCGGALTLEEAALDANVPPRELLAALERATQHAAPRTEDVS